MKNELMKNDKILPEREPNSAPVGSQTSPPERILVVDDDTSIRHLVSKVLIQTGYRVDTAEDGAAAWHALHAVRYDPGGYDLLITDNRMPKLTGVELIRKLRSKQMTLPVILASGTLPTYIEPLQLGAVLEKPFSPDDLVKTVKRVIHAAKSINSAVPNPKEFAHLLLAYELASGKPGGPKDSAAFRVSEKLRKPLSKLMGVAGHRSLLSRALALAGAEVPWLRALQLKPDGALEGLGDLEPKLDSRAVVEGEVALVSHLLGLLVIFIGPALTQRLLHDIWPKMDDLNF